MKDYYYNDATDGRIYRRKDGRLNGIQEYEPNQGKVTEKAITLFNISYENTETKINDIDLIDPKIHKWDKGESGGRQITIVEKDFVEPPRNITTITSRMQWSMEYGLVNRKNPRGYEQKNYNDWESDEDEEEEKKDSVIQNLEDPKVEIIYNIIYTYPCTHI